MTTDRLNLALADIDAANSRDPTAAGSGIAKELLYGQRMSEVLGQFMPGAPEVLQIAARAQHIERWVIARASYGEGRIAYLKWRKDLQQHHAKRAAGIMASNGYDEDDIAKVSALLRKEQLKHNPLTQALEDVICLVFLKYEAAEFIAAHDDGKVRDILAKTAKKMSARGLAEASKLTLDPRLGRLLSEALTEPFRV